MQPPGVSSRPRFYHAYLCPHTYAWKRRRAVHRELSSMARATAVKGRHRDIDIFTLTIFRHESTMVITASRHETYSRAGHARRRRDIRPARHEDAAGRRSPRHNNVETQYGHKGRCCAHRQHHRRSLVPLATPSMPSRPFTGMKYLERNSRGRVKNVNECEDNIMMTCDYTPIRRRRQC